MIYLHVPGVPQPAGSKRGFARKSGGVAIVDANPKSRDWKTTVSQAAAITVQGLLEGPLHVEFTFHLVRPKGHFGKKGLLKSAPALPTGRPDVLKLARAVEDALTGIAWRDDAQIVSEVLLKRYGAQAGVEILIDMVRGEEEP